MFANISNHPSIRWDDSQREAATTLGGDILDVAFPNVPPTASLADIQVMAATIIDAIDERVTAALVAGEPTLVVALVRGLQRCGIACYAATTERVSTDGPDGTKTSTLRFIQLRPYPAIA